MGHLNVEFKAKTSRQKEQEEIMKGLTADYKGEDKQTDTYFNVAKGRLKLREGNIENTLIYYNRADTADIKTSDVHLYKLEGKDASLKALLIAAHGVKVIVDKTRRIYFIGNVKFHFDTIAGLGEFVEVEAIDMNGDIGKEKLQKQCDEYATLLGVKEEEYESKSYSDMLMAKNSIK